MKLRTFVGGFTLAAGALACIGLAQAADLPVRPAPAPVAPVAYAPPVYNWSGFYIGGHIGGGFENSKWTEPFTGATDTFNHGGFLGGAQIGANAQFNWLVIGLEGDFSWTSMIKGTGTDTRIPSDTITTSPQWTSTVTGRVGAAFDRLLVYGKGGVAFADDKSTFTPVGGSTFTDTTTRVGWTAGAGLEYALTQNWAVRAEYDYLGFGSKQLTFATAPAVTANASLNVQEIKAGFDYKFGP